MVTYLNMPQGVLLYINIHNFITDKEVNLFFNVKVNAPIKKESNIKKSGHVLKIILRFRT